MPEPPAVPRMLTHLEHFLSLSSSRAKANATNWSRTSTCQERAALEAGHGGFGGGARTMLGGHRERLGESRGA